MKVQGGPVLVSGYELCRSLCVGAGPLMGLGSWVVQSMVVCKVLKESVHVPSGTFGSSGERSGDD